MTFRRAGDAAVGRPNLDLDEAEVGAIVRAMLLAIRRARPKLFLSGIRLDENRISVQVHNELPRVQRDLRLQTFEFNLEGIIHDHQGRIAKSDGRIDFKVKLRRQVGHYDDYFGIECKRVDAADHDMIRYYVKAGIGKFADETYGAGHRRGMLVGYLMAPPASAALERVRRTASRARQEVGPWSPYGKGYRDATIVEADLKRASGTSIRLLHVIASMHR